MSPTSSAIEPVFTIWLASRAARSTPLTVVVLISPATPVTGTAAGTGTPAESRVTPEPSERDCRYGAPITTGAALDAAESVWLSELAGAATTYAETTSAPRITSASTCGTGR